MSIKLPGGNYPIIRSYARYLIGKDIRLASHLTDWRFYTRPDCKEVQQLVFDVYKAQIMHPDTNTMEMLTYPDQMAAARERLLWK